jgi:mercuric ion binding protein
MKNWILGIGMTLSLNAFAEKIVVGVDGMVCSFCAQGITKKFKSEKAIRSVDVKLEDKRVTLETTGELSDEHITKLITEAGYKVSSIKRE